jgi:hypothetical protein
LISLFLSLAVLIIGYLLYGKITEKVFAPDDTPIWLAYNRASRGIYDRGKHNVYFDFG